MPLTDTKTYPNAMKPAWNNDGLSQGMFGATFLNGPQWKALERPDAEDRLCRHWYPWNDCRQSDDVLNITPDGSSATRTVDLPMPAVLSLTGQEPGR
jgi:hypothetical protein